MSLNSYKVSVLLDCKVRNASMQWEFAQQFSEPIARFLRKNGRMSDLLKKRAIRSFLESDVLTSLIFGELPERFAHQKRGNEQIANFL